MEHLKLEERFDCPAATVWQIIGTLDRVDWVPGINSAELKGNRRHMTMDGDQSLVEEIFHHDTDAMEIEYGVVESAAGIQHHRAQIKLVQGEAAGSCVLHWSLDVEPDALMPVIRQMMEASLREIHRITADN